MAKTIIGVMGGGNCDSETARLAYEIGRGIAARQYVLLCGGGGGVMEASAKGAKEAHGETIGILYSHNPEAANPHIDLIIPTGMRDARNVINVLASKVVFAIGGSGGTLSEIALAIKNDRHVIGLKTCGFHFPGGSSSPLFHEVATVEEALNLLDRLVTS